MILTHKISPGQTSSSSLGSTLGAASGLSDASEYQGGTGELVELDGPNMSF
jgi:hypothetical protein